MVQIKKDDLRDTKGLCPTLKAVDRAIEEKENSAKPRGYLGFSAIGNCPRELWYQFRWVLSVLFSAHTLKLFSDGHTGEDTQADRLRLLSDITLVTLDPETGRQYEVLEAKLHGKGHADGLIKGILQNPKPWLVWEHKQTNDKKFNELRRLLARQDESTVLRAWDDKSMRQQYYEQHIIYMELLGLEGGYMTVATPGGRDSLAFQTKADPDYAKRLIAKARMIVDAKEPPAGVSRDPSFFQCKWCNFKSVCHEGQKPDRNCRTCLHSTPELGGVWHCAHWDKPLTYGEQRAGCEVHRYIPSLLKGKVRAVVGDGADAAITYDMDTGEVFVDD